MNVDFNKISEDIVTFINNLNPMDAYNTHIEKAIEDENYELAQTIKDLRIKECGS